MDTPQPPHTPEPAAQTPEAAPSNRPARKKDEILGCGCLIIVALGLLMLLKSCFFSGSESSADELMERKLAFLEYGISAETDSPQAAEYKSLLMFLANRFEITEKEVGNMTYSVVKDLKEQHGSKATTLEMLRAMKQLSTSRNADMLGKGKRNYASAVAMLYAQMIPSR